ncbi:MAG: acetyl-CoA carboxylase carboxyltransferase subunit alpha [Planctomycetota bacterium]
MSDARQRHTLFQIDPGPKAMSVLQQLDFEREIYDLDTRIAEARRRSGRDAVAPHEPVSNGAGQPGDASRAADGADAELELLEAERHERLEEIYRNLTPWQTVRVARHPSRPQSRDLIDSMCREFTELHGDRTFGDDPAIVTGFARLGHHKCMVVGHHKGRSTEEKLKCHFGCAHPEGYRKALAKMRTAEKFGIPIVTFVDTPGAYPGLGAEQRGQAEAIAVNLREMSRLRTPTVSVVIGEGGSGGALGIAVSDTVAMLRNAWYSVISPEGCAAILWKAANETTNAEAARSLRLTAADNLELGVIDHVIEEPVGGAHRDPAATADAIKRWVVTELDRLLLMDVDDLIEARYNRFRRLGSFETIPDEDPETGHVTANDKPPEQV